MIYVICPPWTKTGGTELAHQLVYSLVNEGLEACIAYTNSENNHYLNPAFKKYINNYVTENEIKDENENIIVIPETKSLMIKKYQKAQIYIWWMSVDNYFKPKSLKMLFERYGIYYVLGDLKARLLNEEYKCVPIEKMKNVSLHLMQSEYARIFLENNGIKNTAFLSDYINEEYLSCPLSANRERENIILYNPAKGIKPTKKIINYCSEFSFIPLKGMTNDQIKEYMSRAKVYIDFGDHPGKDRLPREAAIMGCCIVTGKWGSAANDVDIKIPSKYKFDYSKKEFPNIKKTIRDLLENYSERIWDYKDYREMISSEKDLFYSQVHDIFC